jgi:O-antigen/teichoic acid export membrane protein
MAAKAFYLFGISMAKGYGKFGIEPATTVIVSLANAALVVVLLLSGASLTAFLWLFALAGVGHVTITTVLLRRARLVPDGGEIEHSIRVRLRQHLLWTVILTGVSVLSNGSVATWLLNRLVGSAEVGYFVIAGALTRGGVELLSSGLTTVLMPVMAHAFGEKGKAGVSSILCDAFRYFQFLGLLLAGAGSLVAPAIVDLAYGPGYQPVVKVVVIMVIVGGLALSEGAFGAVLSTTDNQRLRAGFSIFSVAVSAALAFALIPNYGLEGAVAAFASARLLVFLVLVISVSRFMELRLPFRETILQGTSALVAGALSLGLLLAGNAWWWHFLAGITYAIVFVACTVLLGAWRAKDVVVAASLISRYPRVLGALKPAANRWAARLMDRDREGDRQD